MHIGLVIHRLEIQSEKKAHPDRKKHQQHKKKSAPWLERHQGFGRTGRWFGFARGLRGARTAGHVLLGMRYFDSNAVRKSYTLRKSSSVSSWVFCSRLFSINTKTIRPKSIVEAMPQRRSTVPASRPQRASA